MTTEIIVSTSASLHLRYFWAPFVPFASRQEQQGAAVMPARLKPAAFDATMVVVGAECRESGKVNDCAGL